MRARLSLVAALLALLPGALAPAQALKMPKVELDYDKETDFSAFKTYSWKDPAAAAKDPQMHTRIIWYVERELEKKGLKKTADGQGDLLVRYYAKAHEGLKGTASQGESYLPGGAGQLTTGVDFSKVDRGNPDPRAPARLGREAGVARRDPARLDRQEAHRRRHRERRAPARLEVPAAEALSGRPQRRSVSTRLGSSG